MRHEGGAALPAPRRRRARPSRSRLRSPAQPARSTILSPPDSTPLFDLRRQEADDFYARVTPFELPEDMRNVQRQAFAGMLWNKQHYHYSVHRWLDGDPVGPPPPDARQQGRNRDWPHFAASDILSMPDKWEYPWFAAWDTAFHVVALAMIDPEFAKDQLLLLMREWYMHPERADPRLRMDVRRRQPAGARVGRDSRLPDRGQDLRPQRPRLPRARIPEAPAQLHVVGQPEGLGRQQHLRGRLPGPGQHRRVRPLVRTALAAVASSRRTARAGWRPIASTCSAISLELAREDPVYEDVATKFFEHFVYIGAAVNRVGGREGGLWHDEEGFYYDALKLPDGRCFPIRANTIAGLIPLLAIAVGDRDSLRRFRGFAPALAMVPQVPRGPARGDRRPHAPRHGGAAAPGARRFQQAPAHPPRIMLDEERFLSPHGLRSLSKRHAAEPFVLALDGQRFVLDYEPGESTTPLFGGNSNWRGPVWFPINFLLIEALQKHHYFHGDEFKVECPSGSGRESTLWEVTTELTRRLIGIFVRDENGRRPVNGDRRKVRRATRIGSDLVFFHEYFHGDTGAGLGACHQTGWTGARRQAHQPNTANTRCRRNRPAAHRSKLKGFGLYSPGSSQGDPRRQQARQW
mgnify:CR=1 FL=1